MNFEDKPTTPDCIMSQFPDFSRNGVRYYFKEMMCVRNGEPYPLRYDDVGCVLDFFDWSGDKYWIDCGEKVTKVYNLWRECENN